MSLAPARGKQFALAGAAFVAFASGAALPFAARHGEIAVTAASLASGLIGMFALFAWIQFDRRERGVPRSPGFNIALAWFALIVAPVYFMRHRARGQRWKPLLGLFLAATVGWNALLLGGMIAGGVIYVVLHGATGVGVNFSPIDSRTFVVAVEKLHPDPAFRSGVRVKFFDAHYARSHYAGEKFTPTPDGLRCFVAT